MSLMFKTVGESCNLACDYCYYSRTRGVLKTVKHMEISLMKKLMREYMKKTKGIASFIWQGGEPLLAGLDFFKTVVLMEAEYAPPNTYINNSVQTNGTLINEQWAAFFKEYNFFVGVSLDGPAEIHNSRRFYPNGLGSFERVMQGIKLLEKYSVDYNILSVIHRGNVGRLDEMFDFYEKNNFKWIQFLPAMEFYSQDPETPATYEITPEQYGKFLCDAFDRWYSEYNETGKIPFSIRFIDNVLSTYLNGNPGFCQINNKCSETLVIEPNGNIYPCDFFMGDQWKLGNISEESLDSMIRSRTYREFMSLKPSLPQKCVSCKWKSKCYGGCPRNRIYSGGIVDVDYFCSAYIRFFEYTEIRMKHIADEIKDASISYPQDWFWDHKNQLRRNPS